MVKKFLLDDKVFLRKYFFNCILSVFLIIFSFFFARSHCMPMDQFRLLEKAAKGRLGVYAINTENNKVVAFHSRERFPMCSTHKVMAVAAMLKASESSPHVLKKIMRYNSSELVEWSPETEKYVDTGMTFQALARSAITLSDNTAANMIVKSLGGPEVVTSFARSIGDNRFFLSRYEPKLNSANPGDMRDTSTPFAMAKSLRQLVLGHVLALKQRQLLKKWLIENTTGDKRIRAGVPKDWVVGDKTGACGNFGAMGDIAVIWPNNRPPMIVVIYFTAKNKEGHPPEDLITKAAVLVLREMNHLGS